MPKKRYVNKQRVIKKDTREQRESVRNVASPAISIISKMVDLLKPWELNPINKYRTFQEMIRDPDVYASIESRTTAIEAAQSKHSFRYDKNSERSIYLKNYLDFCIHTMKGTTRSVGKNASESIINGVAPFEISTKLETQYPEFTGLFVLDKLTYIDPLTIEASKPFETANGGREISHLRQRYDAFRDTDGTLKELSKLDNGIKKIDFRKVCMTAYNATEGKPFGTSPLEAAYVAWKEKVLIQDYLLVGIQKDLAGTPVLRVPMQLFDEAKDPNSTAAETLETLKLHMANLHAGDQTYMILPSDTFSETGNGAQLYDVKFEGINGTNKNFDLVAILEQKKKTIYNVLGAAHLITGESGGGSYNLVEGKANIAAHYAERDNTLIDEMYNEQIIPLLFRLNGFTQEKLSDIPVYVHGEVQPLSIEEWSKGFQRVQRALPITPDVVNSVLRRLQIDYQVDLDTPQEELQELMLLAGLQLNQANGSSGTGDSQEGGANSATNSENAA